MQYPTCELMLGCQSIRVSLATNWPMPSVYPSSKQLGQAPANGLMLAQSSTSRCQSLCSERKGEGQSAGAAEKAYKFSLATVNNSRLMIKAKTLVFVGLWASAQFKAKAATRNNSKRTSHINSQITGLPSLAEAQFRTLQLKILTHLTVTTVRIHRSGSTLTSIDLAEVSMGLWRCLVELSVGDVRLSSRSPPYPL